MAGSPSGARFHGRAGIAEGLPLTSIDPLKLEIEALRNRISKLSAACLRISASLDLDTILSEVVECARALTGARYGVITTISGSGPAENVVTSGFTPDEHCKMLHWEHGLRLFEHFRDLQGALRVKDLPAFVRSLGLSPGPRPCGPSRSSSRSPTGGASPC